MGEDTGEDRYAWPLSVKVHLVSIWAKLDVPDVTSGFPIFSIFVSSTGMS